MILNHKLTQFACILAIVMLVLVIIYPPEFAIFKKGEVLAGHLMLSMLFMGMIFLVFDQQRLMVVSLAASALIAFYLKTAANVHIKFPDQNHQPNINIAHINLSSVNRIDFNLSKYLSALEVDLVSFQEVTPDWTDYLNKHLGDTYPYHVDLVRIDPFGKSVYSQFEFNQIDTIHCGQVTDLLIELNVENKPLYILSTYLLPPFFSPQKYPAKDHLKIIQDKIRLISDPVISIGDFNLVYWSSEIRRFLEASNLYNSRRKILLSSLQVPYDHLFFTSDLECIHFSELSDNNSTHIGIFGILQFKSEDNPPPIPTLSYMIQESE